MGDARAVEPLCKALGDADLSVRRDAARALGKFGDARAVEPLCGALKDAVTIVRDSAAEALGKIGAPRAVEPLCQALKDKNRHSSDSYDRMKVAEALAKIGDARAVQPLCKALGDKEESLRRQAARSLVKIGAPAVEPLCKALNDANKDVRQAAVDALGEIGDARAVEPLCKALRDADKHVCKSAAEALGRIGDPRARVALRKVLRAGDAVTKRGAALALIEVGDARDVDRILKYIDRQQDDVPPMTWGDNTAREQDHNRRVSEFARFQEMYFRKLNDLLEDFPSSFARSALDSILRLNDMQLYDSSASGNTHYRASHNHKPLRKLAALELNRRGSSTWLQRIVAAIR
jgi:hypothetical protein